MKLNQVTVGATDYAASIVFYQKLGLVQIVDAPPNYARFETPSGETFSIHLAEAIGGGSVIYFEVDDVDGFVADRAELGWTQQAEDKTWLWREARILDPAGNEICIYHAGANRRFPPWRMTTREN